MARFESLSQLLLFALEPRALVCCPTTFPELLHRASRRSARSRQHGSPSGSLRRRHVLATSSGEPAADRHGRRVDLLRNHPSLVGFPSQLRRAVGWPPGGIGDLSRAGRRARRAASWIKRDPRHTSRSHSSSLRGLSPGQRAALSTRRLTSLLSDSRAPLELSRQ